MAESAKRSKKYPGMTAKMARGTVHPETRRKRAAAEAKRQKASGGGFEGPEQGKRVVKNPPRGGGQRGAEDEQRGSGRRTRLEGKGIGTTKGVRLSSRGGQEMPTGGGGRGPSMPKGGASRRGPSGDVRVSGGGPVSAKVGGKMPAPGASSARRLPAKTAGKGSAASQMGGIRRRRRVGEHTQGRGRME